ncbi:MAG TPA: DUF5666 domain-containing protein [Thermoanaerobaculaceae bacterium]|nr:DUF5666 domain-containing protein [Thermoanaerobaculaceae bacterium]
MESTTARDDGATRGRRVRATLAVSVAVVSTLAAFVATAGGANGRNRTVEFCAVVESMPAAGAAGTWTASGIELHVGAATVVDRTQAEPARGVAVVVAGTLQADGSVRATSVAARAAGCPAVASGRRRGLQLAAADAADDFGQGTLALDAVAVGVLGGASGHGFGVAVVTERGGAGELAVSAAGLRPGGRYAVIVDGTPAAEVRASESGTIHLDLSPERGRGGGAPLVAALAGARHLEVVASGGVVAIAGDLRRVAAPRAPTAFTLGE